MKEQKHDSVTDQGWAAMQQLLDQRMPRRRRRVAGWWWFAGLLLLPIAGAAGWQWYRQSKPAYVPTGAPGGSTAPLATLDRADKDKTPVPRRGDPPASGHRQTPENSSNQPDGLNEAPVSRETLFARRLAAAHEAGPNASFLGKTGNTDDVSAGNIPEPATSSTGAGLADHLLAPLPTAFQLLEPTAPEVDLPDYPVYFRPEIIKSPRPSHIVLAATVGANSERLPRINGGVIGFAADWQPLRKWGLRSGMQYAMQRLAVDESLVTVISEDAYEKSSNNLALFDNSGTYGYIKSFSSINTAILASVRRIHRIEAPLSVYWEPVPAFRIYAGATLNYTFLAQTSNKIFSDNQIFKVVSGRDEINRLATERLQRWQVKWQGGLGYRLNRKAEINASVQTTFPKISFKRTAEIQSGLNVVEQATSPFVQVRQVGVTLSGVVFF